MKNYYLEDVLTNTRLNNCFFFIFVGRLIYHKPKQMTHSEEVEYQISDQMFNSFLLSSRGRLLEFNEKTQERTFFIANWTPYVFKLGTNEDGMPFPFRTEDSMFLFNEYLKYREESNYYNMALKINGIEYAMYIGNRASISDNDKFWMAILNTFGLYNNLCEFTFETYWRINSC